MNTVVFGDYTLDCARFELKRSGRVVSLQRLPCELLVLLIERRGAIVSREQIADRLWSPGLHVDVEHSINTAIRKIRHALRDNADRKLYVQTVVGRGYRFVGEIKIEAVGSAHEDAPVVPDVAPVTQIEVRMVEPSPASVVPNGSLIPLRQRRSAIFWSVIAAVISAILISALLLVKREKTRESQGQPPPHSLAVLPILNRTGDPEQDFLADSLTNELTASLGQFHSLRVISPESALKISRAKDGLSQIRRLLNVDAVVQGSTWYVQGRLRTAIQLVDTRTRRHLWANTFDIAEADPDALRTQVLKQAEAGIAKALNLHPTTDMDRGQTPSSVAYNNYLRGRYFWNRRTLGDLENSIVYYKAAITADPRFARAYAALADSYVLLSSYGGPAPEQSLALARSNADKALDLDPDLGEAHAVLGAVMVDGDWNWKGAEDEYRMAVRLNPEYPTAHHWYALHLSRLGRHAEAESEIKQALELDPLSLIINTDAGEIFYRGGRLNEALQYVQKAIELDPKFADAYTVEGVIEERMNRLPEAINALKTAEKLFNDAPNVLALMGHALAVSGQRSRALQTATELQQLSNKRYVSAVDIALVYCALGDSNQSIGWLRRAYERRDKGINILAADPLFANCRNDQRFDDLLTKLRLPKVPLQ